MKHGGILIFIFIFAFKGFSQNLLELKQRELEQLKQQERSLNSEIERLKLAQCLELLKIPGYPSSSVPLETIAHSAYVIGFDCSMKMPAWTFHLVTPDITFGNVSRTNDFRVDSAIACGSSEEKDYFIRAINADGTYPMTDLDLIGDIWFHQPILNGVLLV